jgi:hyperosmotically inducible protein
MRVTAGTTLPSADADTESYNSSIIRNLKSAALEGLMKPTIVITGLLLALGAVQIPSISAQAPRGAGNQAWLMNEVRHQLVLLPYYSVFDNLAYRVDGDKVTLMGQVRRPDIKDDAAKAVKGIEGVQSVDNQIQVLPVSPMDDQIRRAEFQAIYSFPSLQKYSDMALAPIHIIVDNGHVTLEGVVDNEADKDAAGIRANSVPNVFAVTNNLHVQKS